MPKKKIIEPHIYVRQQREARAQRNSVAFNPEVVVELSALNKTIALFKGILDYTNR
ncbi:uncharacterized protein G2W53_043868 [Senna tora]|uniref:Uncharacterized protein n=1 Tax=Senna tora TaxID=362788 RepID=A0A834W0J7_9FABA|nr:uncharacterized protein G2W53_043868 [Senna tora]